MTLPAFEMYFELYDASTPSDGLTVDTPDGPVDTVAVARCLAGDPVALTFAEVVYALAATSRTGLPLGDPIDSRRAAAYHRLAADLLAA